MKSYPWVVGLPTVLLSRYIMRLLRTSDCELVEFSHSIVPPYAILSHTSGDDEYLSTDRNEPIRRDSAGFKKVAGCCAIVAGEGYEFIWIDTCCIDKTSSSELSESINSMYRWYQKARVCYVYLADSLLSRLKTGMLLNFVIVGGSLMAGHCRSFSFRVPFVSTTGIGSRSVARILCVGS